MRLLTSTLCLVVAAGGALAVAAPAAAETTTLPHAVGGVQIPRTRVTASARIGAFSALPSSATLVSNLPPVGDQGQISSCVAWTIAHSIMGYYAKRDGGSGAPYAPLYLYMRSVGGGAPTMGLYPEAALTEAAVNGVDTQDDYVQGAYNWQSPPTAPEIANAANYQVAGWSTLWVGDKQGSNGQLAMQTAIAGGAPVAIAMPVFMDFMYLGGGSLYNTVTGTNLGYHMITAYAYDAEGIWIRNQWGTGWGASGDAHLSWAFVNADVYAAYTVSGVKTPGTAPVTPKPAVAALSVARGPVGGGTEVRITGSNIASATAVRFGDTPAMFRNVESNGVAALVATSPARPKGIVDVTVTGPGGTSAPTARTKFTYVPAAPAVTKLSVASASVLGGETVTVTGTDLTGATAVRVGATVAGSVKVASGTSLTFAVPATLTAGGYDVTLTTPNGTSAPVPAGRLTLVNPPAPTISGLSASTGPTYAATPITVTGTGFNGIKSVTAGGAPVSWQRVSETSLKVTMPVHAAGKVALRVTAVGGSVEASSLPFTYVAPAAPAVTALSPSAGGAKTWTAVELTGANINTATKVTVNGVAVTFVRLSDTKLRISMPPHAAGATSVLVTTPGGTSASAAAATFTYRV